jgi:DNA-binding transcriptional ArsR family regulator
VEVKSYEVPSATGERRTALADRERTRLLEHYAVLREHVAALSRQVVQLGGTPCPRPSVDHAATAEADVILAADLEARPVTKDDVAYFRRPYEPRSREEVAASSTRSRIEAFLHARGGEHTRSDIATALGVTPRAVSVALSKDRDGRFQRRLADPSGERGAREALWSLVAQPAPDAVEG